MSAVKSDSGSRKRSKDRRGSKSAPMIGVEDRIDFNARNLLFALVLFLSGTSSLIYQVLWIKQLSLVVGLEIYSITVAVSAFFLGLAAGGVVLGRWVDRWKRPLIFYCALESAIALAGVVITIALAHTARPFVAIESHFGLLAWAVPFLLVGAPAFLMGGTLPVAVRWLGPRLSRIAKAGGWVYATNTAGGIAGALLSSFALLPRFGVLGTALSAALLSLTAAGITVVLDRLPGSQQVTVKEAVTSEALPTKLRTALALYALAGGIALGYEVVWAQAMDQFLSTRVFAFSVVLATYLAGLSVGSMLYARFSYRVRDAWGMFGFLVSAAGVVALLEVAALNLWQLRFQIVAGNLALSATGSESVRMCVQFFIAAIGVVFVPTVLLGAAFPTMLHLTATPERTGRDVGAVLALNTIGGVAGTLLTGFLLIPTFGLVRTLSFLTVAATAVGAVAVIVGTSVSRKLQWAVFALGLIAVGTSLLTKPDRLSRLLLTTRGGGTLIFYQESRGATVAVAEQRAGDNVFRRLYIQGVSNSGDAMPSMRYMRLQAMLPLLIHRGEPKSALVIGFGTGITAGAVLHYPRLERRVCVELLPAVVHAGELFPENYKAASGPRLQIRISDGRHELLRNPERYDVITLEAPPPTEQGVANLYSTNFYQLARERLAIDGLFAQWLPLTTQNDENTRSLVRSFLDAFPYATLWTTELHEMLLIGSQQPIELDTNKITSRFEQAEVSPALHAVGISSPAALLATWVTGRDALERYAANVSPVTDNDPRIEYAPWVRPGEVTRTLPQLLALRVDPPLVGADDDLRGEIQRQQKTLLDFYTAGIAAYSGDRDRWNQAMEKVLASDSNNPYFLWIAGGRK
jgi:spermidine synthase